MKMRNFTPFAHLAFDSVDAADHIYHTVVVKATFRIEDDGRLLPEEEQAPLVAADEFYGDPVASSVRYESDLSPFKPRTDILLCDPVAVPPQGRPARRWPVRLKVGDKLNKEFVVTGPRAWKKGSLGQFYLTEPAECTAVPIRYELAYGGTWRHKDECEAFTKNPVGRGHVKLAAIEGNEIPAPQLESATAVVKHPNQPIAVVGFGPVGRPWTPRLQRAGTYDKTWEDTRWPLLPQDFDFGYYNAAPADQTVDGYLKGDEEFTLEGLAAEGPIRFRLPRYDVYAFVRLHSGHVGDATLNIDTVVIEPSRRRVYVVWRNRYLKAADIRVVEARLIQPEGAPHG